MFKDLAIGAGGLKFESSEQAQDVLDAMNALIEKYGAVSVGDLYVLIDSKEPRAFIQDKWGWNNLSTAVVLSSSLILPVPVIIMEEN